MTIISTLVVEIVGDISKYVDSLKKSEERTEEFSTRGVSGLSSLGGSIALGGIAAAGVGITALGVGLQDATAEAMAAQEIMTQTQAVIASTGGAAGMSSDSIANLANNLSQVTKFEDDTIQSAENMLLTFTNIGKDVFPAATETVLDMSQALGQDLKSSSVQLGKALNDPVAGITALSRVGVTFTDDQKAMIEQLVKSGDVMGAQKLILAELSREFGGSARAAGQTAAGGWTIFGNMIGNIKESVGAGLLPALSQLGQTLSSMVAKPEVQQFFSDLGATIGTLATQAVTYLPVFVSNLQATFGWFEQNRGIVVAAMAVIGAALVAFAVTSVAAAIPAMVAFVAASWPVLAVIAAVGVAAYLLYQAWDSNFLGIQRIVETWWANLQLIWAVVQDVFSGNWRKLGEDLRKIWDNNWKLLMDLIGGGLTNAKNLFFGWIDGVKKTFLEGGWQGIGQAILEGIGNGITAGLDFAINAAQNTLGALMDAIKGFLGIASPSKLMEVQVGYQMAAGVARGWDGGLDKLMQPAGAMLTGMGAVGAATPSAGGVVINVNVSGGGDFETGKRIGDAVRLALRQAGVA